MYPLSLLAIRSGSQVQGFQLVCSIQVIVPITNAPLQLHKRVHKDIDASLCLHNGPILHSEHCCCLFLSQVILIFLLRHKQLLLNKSRDKFHYQAKYSAAEAALKSHPHFRKLRSAASYAS